MKRYFHVRVNIQNRFHGLGDLCALVVARRGLVMLPLHMQPDGRRTRVLSIVFKVREFLDVLPLLGVDTVGRCSVEPVTRRIEDQFALSQKYGRPAE